MCQNPGKKFNLTGQYFDGKTSHQPGALGHAGGAFPAEAAAAAGAGGREAPATGDFERHRTPAVGASSYNT